MASTVKLPAALTAEQIQRQGKEMSKHDAVPAPVEEYEYAEQDTESLRLSALTFEQLRRASFRLYAGA